jgi:subtilisin family serine protease
MNKILSVLLTLVIAGSVKAQDKYWISFKDKEETGYDYRTYLSSEAIQNRVQFGIALHQYTDIPVNPAYIEAVNTQGARLVHTSRWLNSVSAYMSAGEVEAVRKLSFVEGIYPINPRLQLASCGIAPTPAYVHVAMKQMEVSSFLDDSLTGKGIKIGVIDAGFFDAQNDKMLKHLFEEKKIIAQKDFLAPERLDLITEKATNADYHGRMVLDMIAGYNTTSRELMGMAPNGRFYLARTEHGDKEFRGEEDTWVAAMEWMDSHGVRLINTSLGYAIKMDDPNDNYVQEQMDGQTARITKGAQIATDEKGIFLVVSAGNEGSNPFWEIISAPADGKGVLAVGATKSSSTERIEYSSIGPAFLPYLKPNVSCYSPNGTSFSSPAVAGFVACMMQRAPNLNNKQLKEIIEKSAHLYPYGNNFVGYGIPKASRALALIEDPNKTFGKAIEKDVNSKSYTLKIDKTRKQDAVLFHKKNETIVLSQTTVAFKKGKLKVRKPEQAARTTVSYQDEVIEIIWE